MSEQYDQERPPSPASPTTSADDRRDDGQGHLRPDHLRLDDLDGTFESSPPADVDVVEEPTDQPYGVRDCAIRDPAGNLIRINQLA